MIDHPVVIILLGAALVAGLPRRAGAIVAVLTPVVALVRVATLEVGTTKSWNAFGYDLVVLRLDDLSLPFAYIFLVATALAGLFGARTLNTVERVTALATAGFGLGVVLAGDLFTLFVMWETKAVVSAVLIAAAGRARSVRAAFRYLLVHVVGGSLMLGGIVWYLAGGAGLEFVRFESGIGAYAVLFGVLLSAAAPPLHAWLPDAYPEASVAGTVFLSIFTTKAAVYALLRGFGGYEILVGVGVGMALYGVVFAVLENDIRRLLGYHIVSQVGYMVAAVGIGTAAAINGATAHAFAHILYKGLLLMGVGAVLFATGHSRLTDLGGLGRHLPKVLLLYMVGAVSISGVPLFSGFVSKELIVDAARSDGLDAVVILLKLASVGTFVSVALKLPWFTFGGGPRTPVVRPVPPTMIAAMALAAAANVAIGVRPELMYDLMPFAVDYQPYTGGKLLEVTQLLTFAGLAFLLVLRKLHGAPTMTLDADWAYRVLPRRFAARARTVSMPSLPRPRPVGVGGAMAGLRSAVAGAGTTPTVTPTAVLGGLAMGAFVVILLLGLVS
jgi:multicomponent Na+:H+ antiporter subunit D